MAYAAACKAVYPSSILGVASRVNRLQLGLGGRVRLFSLCHPECTVKAVHVLICSRSEAKGRFAEDILSKFPDITIAGRVYGDDAIRSALVSIPFDVCILGPTSVEKKYDLDPLANGVNYPVRKYVMLNTHVTTERVILAHQLGMNDVIDIGLHMAAIDARLEKVLKDEINLANIASITEIVQWLRSDNIAHLAQDEMDIRILIELIEGRTNEEIAGTVNLALQTVRNRISRLMKAAEVSNRTQLATLLLR
jgi:DNA-binding NarL/FixJ family response regulator